MGNKTFKRLTFEERIQIENLLKKDYSMMQIANSIGRSYNGIATEIRINGGKENYTAQDAEERSNETRKRSNAAMHLPYKLNEKIESLQMQIDILTETIEGIKNERQ